LQALGFWRRCGAAAVPSIISHSMRVAKLLAAVCKRSNRTMRLALAATTLAVVLAKIHSAIMLARLVDAFVHAHKCTALHAAESAGEEFTR
jgi:hypothetical protein